MLRALLERITAAPREAGIFLDFDGVLAPIVARPEDAYPPAEARTELERLVAIGLIAGFFSALFGVGGGIVVVPLLILWLVFPTRDATATSLAAIFITAVSGVITYAAHGDVRLGYAALVGLPAAAGAVGGTALQQRLRVRTVELLFAALLAAVAVWLFLK